MERIDDLQCKGYRIIQDSEAFCYGTDAVLLANFAKQGVKRGRVFDLCTGNGIVPLLLAAKTEAESIYGIEIQREAVELARRSVALNKEERIHILEGDLCKIQEQRTAEGKSLASSFTVVTANPPYMQGDLQNPLEKKNIARHEVSCSFSDVAEAARYLLAPKGKFYLVHRPKRMAEIISILREKGLEPKRLQMVHSFVEGEAKLFLLEAVRGASVELRILPPLILYREKGVYTKELLEIYGMGASEAHGGNASEKVDSKSAIRRSTPNHSSRQ